MSRQWLAVGAAWLLTLGGGIAVALVLRPAAALPALALVLAGAVAAAFALQLLLGEQDGFVSRVSASVSGSFGIVLLTAAAVAVLG